MGDGIGELFAKFSQAINNGAYSVFDPDAKAFFDAAGITDATQQEAVNQFVLSTKAANIWSKFLAVFPFVGGSAIPHSYNLANPSLHQITWNGTVVHNGNGVTGNGINGYGEVSNLRGEDTVANDSAFGAYVRTNSDGPYHEIGSNQMVIFALFAGSAYFDNAFNGGSGRTSTANTDSRGLFVSSRTGAAVHKGYRNGSQIGPTCTGAQGDLSVIADGNFAVAATGGSPPINYSPRNFCFAFVSSGLSDADVSALYTAVQTMQTTLGRNV